MTDTTDSNAANDPVPEPTATIVPTPKKLTRDELRAAIFGQKAAVFTEKYAGVDIELREPSLGEILDMQLGDDRKVQTANMLINFCFVPGTLDPIFEEADLEGILALPYSADYNTLITRINTMMGVAVTADDKSGTPKKPDSLEHTADSE